jgi:hypothetical protein
MLHLKAIAISAAAVASVTLMATAANAACYHAGGSATMVTIELAKFMAEAALKNSIAAHGWTAKGPVKMVCKEETLTTSCTARRVACG